MSISKKCFYFFQSYQKAKIVLFAVHFLLLYFVFENRSFSRKIFGKYSNTSGENNYLDVKMVKYNYLCLRDCK